MLTHPCSLSTHTTLYIYCLSNLICGSVVNAEAFLHFHVVRQRFHFCLACIKTNQWTLPVIREVKFYCLQELSSHSMTVFCPAVRDHVRVYAQWLTLTSLPFVHNH